MGNVSLKVLEKSLNFLFKNGYEPCISINNFSPERVDSKGLYGRQGLLMGDEGSRLLSIAITKKPYVTHKIQTSQQLKKTCGDPFSATLQEI